MKQKQSLRLWAVLFWLCIWQLGSIALGSEILLVSPLKVIWRLGQLAVTAVFWKSVGISLMRIVGGFLLAMCSGVVLAALAARYRLVRELLAPAVLTIKTVPVASFIILALIWFSTKTLAVFISFLMVLPVIYTNTLEAIHSADRQLLEMAQIFSLPVGRRLRCIYLPQVMPQLRAACTVALGLCWKAGVAAEVIGMPVGSIGARLQQAKIYLNTPDLFAWTLTVVLLSLAFERLFLALLSVLSERLERV